MLVRSLSLTVALLSAIAFVTADISFAEDSRPNIVLIMADDMGYECIAANGSLDYKTPNIDRIAAGGMRFEHCYSQPICTPSRVKLMTGLSNKRNYVKFGKLDRKQTTFAHLLKEAGYKTAIVGKWQLGKELDSPQHFGFEQSLLWQHTRGRTNKQKHDTRYPNPRLERNGKQLEFSDGDFSTDVFYDFISEFVESNKDAPFLLYYPMCLVHCPFCPTPDSKAWDPKSLGSKDYKGKPEFFADMVAYTDKQIGRIDAKLKEIGVRDNTLLMFVGDNGTDVPIVTRTSFGEVAGAKGSMTDGGNHVPCVISWPRHIQQGSVRQDIVDFSDFLPTMCGAAGVKVPEKLGIDGVSFLSQLKGESGQARDSIFMWYSRNGRLKEAREFARDQKFKLYGDGKFYNVQQDRLEKRPLATGQLDDDAARAKAKLQKHLDEFKDVKLEGRK